MKIKNQDLKLDNKELKHELDRLISNQTQLASLNDEMVNAVHEERHQSQAEIRTVQYELDTALKRHEAKLASIKSKTKVLCAYVGANPKDDGIEEMLAAITRLIRPNQVYRRSSPRDQYHSSFASKFS